MVHALRQVLCAYYLEYFQCLLPDRIEICRISRYSLINFKLRKIFIKRRLQIELKHKIIDLYVRWA